MAGSAPAGSEPGLHHHVHAHQIPECQPVSPGLWGQRWAAEPSGRSGSPAKTRLSDPAESEPLWHQQTCRLPDASSGSDLSQALVLTLPAPLTSCVTFGK